MKIKKRVLVLAVLMGLLTAALLYIYIQGLNGETVQAQANLKNVIVATNTIPAHVKITPEMLALKSLPTEAIHPEAAESIEGLVGTTTKVEIVSGEQVLSSRVITEGVTSPLAYRIPENMRAITIPMNEISGVAGYIMPGDKIDIIVSYSDEKLNPGQFVITQFQNVEVLEKGPYSTDPATKQVGVASSLTLLVSPPQAEVLAYANLSGSMQFTLRNPIDSTKVILDKFDANNFSTWRDR